MAPALRPAARWTVPALELENAQDVEREKKPVDRRFPDCGSGRTSGSRADSSWVAKPLEQPYRKDGGAGKGEGRAVALLVARLQMGFFPRIRVAVGKGLRSHPAGRCVLREKAGSGASMASLPVGPGHFSTEKWVLG